MTRTDEQLAYARRLEELIRPTLGERVRVVPDAEGFPIVPGALGRIEYLGTRCGPVRDGTRYAERLHVYTDRRRIIAKLHAVPGVERRQMGDTEARLAFAPDDAATLQAVAATIRPRQRRASSTGNLAALARARARGGARQGSRERAEHGRIRSNHSEATTDPGRLESDGA